MNNKNILLFYFFLCVLNTNATSIGIKLEQTKNAWFACKKRPPTAFERRFGCHCSDQEEAYNEVKQELLVSLRAIEEEGIQANKELSDISNSLITNFFTSEKEKHTLKQKIFLAYIASRLLEALAIHNDIQFESSYYNNKTFTEYYNDMLEIFVTNSWNLSSRASNMMGPLEATEPELEEAIKIFRLMIEKM